MCIRSIKRFKFCLLFQNHINHKNHIYNTILIYSIVPTYSTSTEKDNMKIKYLKETYRDAIKDKVEKDVRKF